MNEEEDYVLLQENNNNVPRKQFKRLKKAMREDESSGEVDGTGKGGRTAEEKLKRSLFGDDDGQSLEGEDEQLEEEDTDFSEEDEMDDFIVDEEEVDEHGAPLRRKKPKKSSHYPEIFSFALGEAHKIFGGFDSLLRAHKLETRDRCSGSWKQGTGVVL